MKHLRPILIAAVTALLAVAGAQAQPAAELMAKADSAYSAEDYIVAADLYNLALQQGSSAELQYNLGNAYWRLGRPGRAVLAYERALRHNPAMGRARRNLDFVNTRITDRPGERGTFVGNALDAAALRARSDAWAWAALGCFVLLVGGLACYAFATGVTLRKVGFFGAGAMLVAVFVFLFLSGRSARLCASTAEAVVIKPSTLLSTAPRTPRDRSQEAMLLHEGTRVTVLDSVRSAADSLLWLDVQVDNTHRAWLDARDVERILLPRP